MSRFAITRGNFGTFATLILSDTTTGARAEIALRGATLNSYAVPHAGGLLNVVAGYETPEDFAALKGSRSRIMAPWSNRIQHSRYTYHGQTLELPKNPAKPHILHGFVGNVDFEVIEQRTTAEGATATFSTMVLRPGAFQGYPFSVDVQVTYALTAQGLMVEIAAQNVGDEDAPFGCGWHPYFRTGDNGIDHLRLSVPCRQKVVTDPELIPVPDDSAFIAIEDAGELDFRPDTEGNGRALGALFVDGAFAQLDADKKGVSRSWIQDDQAGVKLIVLQKGGMMHVFTGDRRSLAMEPVQFMTNAFNRPECREAITIRAGHECRFIFGVEVQA